MRQKSCQHQQGKTSCRRAFVVEGKKRWRRETLRVPSRRFRTGLKSPLLMFIRFSPDALPTNRFQPGELDSVTYPPFVNFIPDCPKCPPRSITVYNVIGFTQDFSPARAFLEAKYHWMGLGGRTSIKSFAAVLFILYIIYRWKHVCNEMFLIYMGHPNS